MSIFARGLADVADGNFVLFAGLFALSDLVLRLAPSPPAEQLCG